jgi:holliday junction DNA helicase RuvB
VAEPFLVRAGLMARTPRGRVATPAAWRHLGLPVPRQAAWLRQSVPGPDWPAGGDVGQDGTTTLFD